MTNITVTNTYTTAGGGTPSGNVTFTPVVSAADGGSVTFLADPISVPVVAGVLTTSILTTDSFNVEGTVTYRVVERVGATYRRRYYVAIPSSLGASVVLSTLTSTSTPPNTIVIEGGADLDEELDAIDVRLDALEAEDAVSVHVAETDPHTQYLDQDDTDALYATLEMGLPTGGADNQVLAKSSGSDYQVEWVDQTATAITSPFTVTADAVDEVPITAQGMAAQTADIFNAKLNGGALALGVVATGQVEIGNAPPAAGTLRIEQAATTEAGLVIKQKAAGTADPIQVTDSGGTEVFAVEDDGTVVAVNIGAKVIVLDDSDPIPGSTPDGTVVLRRPPP